MDLDTIISIFLGVGLAASVGFRVFLPLFALSLAAHFNIWELNGSWQWLGSLPAVIALGAATAIEIFAYFIPWVDNVLDSIAVPLAAIAGTAVMMSTMADMGPLVTWTLAIIAGGGTATAIKSTAAVGRVASTATTGGLANPLVGLLETGVSAVMSLVSIFLPFLAILLVIILLFFMYRIYKKFVSKPKPKP